MNKQLVLVCMAVIALTVVSGMLFHGEVPVEGALIAVVVLMFEAFDVARARKNYRISVEVARTQERWNRLNYDLGVLDSAETAGKDRARMVILRFWDAQ